MSGAWALKVALAGLPEPGRFSAVAEPVVIAKISLRDLAERYLVGSRHRLSRETERTYRVGLKAAEDLVVDGGLVLERDVHDVTQGWAQRVHDAVRERSGGATADKLAKLLGAAHRFAANRGENLPPNAWGQIERYGSPQLEIHFSAGWLVDALEVIELAVAQAGLEHPTHGRPVPLPGEVGDFFTFGLTTGARPWCEIRRLRWADIDEAKGTITFAFSKGDKRRSKRLRKIPLSILCQRGRDALARQRERAGASPNVWPGRDPKRPAGETKFARWWVPFRIFAAKHINMADAHGEPLDLYRASRHAFASHMGDLGFPPHLIAEFLGHTDHRSQARYVHLSGRHLQAPAKELAASLDRRQMQAAVAIDTAPGLVPERLALALEWIERQNKVSALLHRPQIEILKADGEPYSARTWASWRQYGRGVAYTGGARKPDDIATHQIALAIGISVGWLYGEGGDELPEVRS